MPGHEQREQSGVRRSPCIEPSPEPASGDEEHGIRGQNVAIADVEVTGERSGPVDREQHGQWSERPDLLRKNDCLARSEKISSRSSQTDCEDSEKRQRRLDKKREREKSRPAGKTVVSVEKSRALVRKAENK